MNNFDRRYTCSDNQRRFASRYDGISFQKKESPKDKAIREIDQHIEMINISLNYSESDTLILAKSQALLAKSNLL